MDRMELHFLWLAVLVLAMPGPGGTGIRAPLPLRPAVVMERSVPVREVRLGKTAAIAVSGRAAIAGLALDKAGV